MNDETKLPEDLQHAVDLIMESDVLHEVAQESAEAIRAEHTQRMTLQHHAADMAQQIEDLRFAAEAGGRRIAELEAERDNTAGHIASIARQIGDDALQVDDIAVRVLALVAEHDAAQRARRDAQELAERYQNERNKAGVQARREVAEQVRELTVERDRLQHAYHQQRDAAQARVDAAVLRALAAEKERDDLRARLAEVEAQEPVAISKAGNLFWAGNPQDWRGVDCRLYARPVPAIPADPGMLTVSMAPSSAYAMGWNDCRAKMINEAPEYKA